MKVLILIAIVFSINSLADEIHLEHSFLPEGSSWGTEGHFQKKLKLNIHLAPQKFQLKANKKPIMINVSQIPLSKERFINNQVALYNKEINICVNENLPKIDKNLLEPMETLLKNVAGNNKADRLFNIRLLQISRDYKENNCDLIVERGDWKAYPYKFLPDSQKFPKLSPTGKVFGLFFRYDNSTIPVVVFHPDIKFSYNPKNNKYVSVEDDQLVVDGRALLLHEIGHFLGFAHIKPKQSISDFPEATIMGVHQQNRSSDAHNLRYLKVVDLWKYWDVYQTSVYRATHYAHFNGKKYFPEYFIYICTQPGDIYSVTAPSVKNQQIYSHLKNEYIGSNLFKPYLGNDDDLRFSPIKDLTLKITGDDFEGEVEIIGVRFLISRGKLYSWIILRGGVQSGVAHKLKVSIFSGDNLLKEGKPHSVNNRTDYNSCF